MFNNIALGASEYANILEESEMDAESAIYSSGIASHVPYLLDKVDTSWRRAFANGWDGLHSYSISYSTKINAELFVKNFPFSLPNQPVVAPDSDGCISFEWEKANESFTVLIKECRIVYSAFLTNDERRKASLPFKNEISKELISLINYFGQSS